MKFTEEWKPINGIENAYISNMGNIFYNGQKISFNHHCEGYIRVRLDGETRYVHRLVAQAFIPNPENKPIVNHIDGNKINNRIENLEWVTAKENAQHASRTGLLSKDTGRKGYIIATDASGQQVFFENQADMTKRLGLNDRGRQVNKFVKGKRKTLHGYKLMYYEGSIDDSRTCDFMDVKPYDFPCRDCMEKVCDK